MRRFIFVLTALIIAAYCTAAGLFAYSLLEAYSVSLPHISAAALAEAAFLPLLIVLPATGIALVTAIAVSIDRTRTAERHKKDKKDKNSEKNKQDAKDKKDKRNKNKRLKKGKGGNDAPQADGEIQSSEKGRQEIESKNATDTVEDPLYPKDDLSSKKDMTNTADTDNSADSGVEEEGNRDNTFDNTSVEESTAAPAAGESIQKDLPIKELEWNLPKPIEMSNTGYETSKTEEHSQLDAENSGAVPECREAVYQEGGSEAGKAEETVGSADEAVNGIETNNAVESGAEAKDTRAESGTEEESGGSTNEAEIDNEVYEASAEAEHKRYEEEKDEVSATPLEVTLQHTLVAAAADEKDVSLILIQTMGEEVEDEAALTEAFHPHEIFNIGECTHAIIKVDMAVDTALYDACNAYNALTEGGRKCYIGISARSIRLIDAATLLHEAQEALSKARVDETSPVIAFRADTDKYRSVLAGKKDTNGA